eukprot:8610419-Pyramimonas_sp.AAC.2
MTSSPASEGGFWDPGGEVLDGVESLVDSEGPSTADVLRALEAHPQLGEAAVLGELTEARSRG